MLLNSNQIARVFSTYPMAVTRAVKAGKLTKDNNGLIDTDEAEQIFKRKPDLSVIAGQLELKSLTADYLEARTKRLEAEGQIKNLELRKLKGELIEKDDVAQAAQFMGASVLQQLLVIPYRLSCVLEGQPKETIEAEFTKAILEAMAPLKGDWLEYWRGGCLE